MAFGDEASRYENILKISQWEAETIAYCLDYLIQFPPEVTIFFS